MSRLRFVPSASWIIVLAATAGAIAGENGEHQTEGQFIRLTRSDRGQPVALEASVVRFLPRDCSEGGPVVDLVSAVHVAEKAYYDRLNELFRSYDAVLFELVAPKGVKIPEGGPPAGGHPVSMLQRGMTEMLGLEFQLNGIDYQPPNLVHADMSAEEFAQSMRRRGESMFQIFFRMMGYAMAQQSSGSGQSDLRLLLALFSKDRALAMKRLLAEQMEDLEGSLAVVDGPDGSTLISERNKVALGVLRRQISEGNRRLAIFYGAGHMPDLARRLRADFGLTPSSTRWLVAWDLTDGPMADRSDGHNSGTAE